MASSYTGSVPAKMSFAKIVAMPAPASARISQHPTQAKQIAPGKPRSGSSAAKNQNSVQISASGERDRRDVKRLSGDIQDVTGAIEGLALVKEAAMAEEANNTKPGTDSTEDDRSHLSNSSSKPQSFDTKSMISVTTFAMDEKESIRPDDSASVRAADEDDSNVPPAFTSSGPQRTSEQAVIAARANPRFAVNVNTVAARRFPMMTMANPPRFGDMPLSTFTEAEPIRKELPALVPEEPRPEPRFQLLTITPDEKLLEALASPKDRLPLLQLEERVLAFISSDQEEVLDFPPQNAFQRLLAHKLADYYSLQHAINDDNTSVRMYKSGCRTLPVPIHVIALQIPSGPQPPAGGAMFKIMRRNGLGNRQLSAGGSTPASSFPSQATSETGGDNSDEGMASPTEGTPPRDRSKMTREEREASYKAARDRIFGDTQEAVTGDVALTAGEVSVSVSRSSSSSGKRKARKQRTPKDDTFDARSSYVPAYAAMPMPNFAGSGQHSFGDHHQVNQYPSAAGYTPSIDYGTTPTQAYAQFQNHNYGSSNTFAGSGPLDYGSADAWSNSQSTTCNLYANPEQPQQNFQPPFGGMSSVGVNTQYAPPPHLHTEQSGSTWSQTPSSNYQVPHPNSQPQSPQWPAFSSNSSVPPYQYGQLPPHAYTNHSVYNNQHPVPGSYTSPRSLFNPQTRSFIPSNTSSRSGGRNSRKKNVGTPVLVRDDSTTNSATSYESTPPSFRGGAGSQSSACSPKLKEDSLQQKYGAPAHLPKKPPPSQVPHVYDIGGAPIASSQSQPAQSNGSNGGPLVIEGG